MGWWKLEVWKKDDEDKEVVLENADLENIAQKIKDGYLEGEVV